MGRMKGLIAEYELRDLEKRTLTFREMCAQTSLWRNMLRLLLCSWLWIIPLALLLTYILQLRELQELRQNFSLYMLMQYTTDPLEATSDMFYDTHYLLSEMASAHASWISVVQGFGIILLMQLYKIVGSCISVMRMPFSLPEGIGLGSVDVMRITRRGCLLVGRRSGVCMRFPWADYVSAKVEASTLTLKKQKPGRGIRLPLPLLSAEEQSRLQRELDAVFADPPSTAPTAIPAHAEQWRGAKPSDMMALDAHSRRTRLRSLRWVYFAAWCVLCAIFIVGMLCCGFVPKLTCILAAVYGIMLLREAVVLPAPALWHYVFGRVRYVLYPPYGGACRIPRTQLLEVVTFPRLYLLRLRDDAYALLPCKQDQTADIPQVPCGKRLKRYLAILAIELLLLCLYWGTIKLWVSKFLI